MALCFPVLKVVQHSRACFQTFIARDAKLLIARVLTAVYVCSKLSRPDRRSFGILDG